MPAIRPHKTAVVDEAWDGPKMVARLKNDGSAAYYRKMFAWVDQEGDPETKSAYKFPHHMVDGEGNIGAANIRACIAGIAALNGARGGAKIPEDDRPGVWRHLAAHLKDAGVEPPDLRALDALGAAVERRALTAEMRAEMTDAGPRLVGYAAVFEQRTLIWDFYEEIAPGAFRRALEEGQDVVALWNHDTNYVLGRRSAGTLHLTEDERGLRVEILPPDTQWARDLVESIRRGDVKQMSFSFRVPEGGEEWYTEGGRLVRRLKDVDLFDVSPVTFPAYPQTKVGVRSPEAWLAELRRLVAAIPTSSGAEGRGEEDEGPKRASQGRRWLWRAKVELARRL